MDGLQPLEDLGGWLFGVLQSTSGFEIGTLVLAVVFLWSGAAKIAQPRLAALAIADFGIVRRAAPWQGAALGSAELCLGLALLTGQGMPVVLPMATLVLLAFSLLILKSLSAGERFSCFCFGGSDDRLSMVALIRSGALVLLASLLWLAPAATASRNPLDADTYLGLCVAIGLILTCLMAVRVPRLLRWNREVTEHFRERAAICAQ